MRSDGSLIKYYGSLGLNTGATASTIFYLASDGLGSLQVTLNGSGSATALQLNAPYGAVRYSSGVFPTSKGFTGQRSDAAVSGLDYYGARYYDPRLGQFTSADSVLDGLNRYAYVGGNPETKTDPSGHGQDVAVPQGWGSMADSSGFAIDLSGLGSAIGGLLAATVGAGIAAITHSPAQQGHIVTANGHWAIYSNTSTAAIAGPTSWMTTINQADLVGHRHINVPTTQVPWTTPGTGNPPTTTGTPPDVSVPRTSGGMPQVRLPGSPPPIGIGTGIGIGIGIGIVSSIWAMGKTDDEDDGGYTVRGTSRAGKYGKMGAGHEAANKWIRARALKRGIPADEIWDFLDYVEQRKADIGLGGEYHDKKWTDEVIDDWLAGDR